MNAHSNLSENFFKLLIPATALNRSDRNTIQLCGKPWVLVDFKQLSDAPPYTCISYSWGKTETINIFGNDRDASVRTTPVIETVINAIQSTECEESAMKSMFFSEEKLAEKLALVRDASHAIWIDSLCCPQQQPEAEICIQNMGEIYSEATQVFVVLNTDCDKTVLKISKKESLNLEDYLAIANDDWIDRLWTYQEFANSKMMFIVAEDKGSAFISELQFLCALMSDAVAYDDIQDIELFQKLERMNLLVAEQQMEERSALQIMSATQERYSERKDTRDHINVMLSVLASAVTITPPQEQSLMTLFDHFMSACEEKDDYSFIFSTSPRSNVLGRNWRPMGDQITPVISNVLVVGRGLSGVLKETHLQMNNMCRMVSKTNLVISRIENFLKTDFPNNILKQLRQRGFTGCGECLKLEHGYFFPQLPHKRSSDLFIAISHDVTFHHGAPGLLLRSTNTDINQFCDTGVFIGKPPAISETINIS